jgi:Domain of unknown function (DUF4382)
MKSFILKISLSIALTGLLLQSCGDDSMSPVMKGPVEFQITDGPSDDDNVKAVFVTVTDVKVDGQSLNGFVKQTIDIKSFSEGNTKLLVSTTMVSKTYNNLTLVLDADTDANGNSPGCYVQTTDDAKFKLRSGKVEILVSSNWAVGTNSLSAVVIDFDLRKAIRSMDDPSVRYNFVADNNLKTAVRVVDHTQIGAINGAYVDQSNVSSDKVIVYAYKKGTYNAAIETAAQGDDKIYFVNAISSAVVKNNVVSKNYTLVFLDEGDYELHFASYKKGADHYTFQSMLANQNSVNGGITDFVTIKAGLSISVSSLITGGM